MTYCPNCGAKLEGTESFCPYCGKLFEKRNRINENTVTSQIEVLQNDVSHLKNKLVEKQTNSSSFTFNQKKQNSDCWKYCCIIFLLMMIFSIFPWTFYF